MVWTYLSQFWDSVANATVTSGEYTVAWFQSLGNAVAGAIGSVFDSIFHVAIDAFIIIGYIINILFIFFKGLIRPIDYFFNYLLSGMSALFAPLSYTPAESWSIPTNIIEIFNAIPFWSTFTYSLTAVILFLVGYKIFRLITKI